MKLRRAWAAPAAVAVVIAAAVAAPGAFASDPHPSLPHRSAAQLLAAVERSDAKEISGNFQTVADLGLPKLPQADTGNDQWTQVFTGTAQWHVWDAGLTRQRVALLGEGQEFDTVDDDGIFWTWNSTTQTATREIVRIPTAPAGGRHGGAGHGAPLSLPDLSQPANLTPTQLAHRTLRLLSPTTAVAVGPTTRVAGRPAYNLDLIPRTPASLLGRVRIAVDARTGTPLGVQLIPRGSNAPAFTTEFTSVSFDPIPAGVFRFRPPAGAKVRVERLFGSVRRSGGQPHVLGSGWAAVLCLPGQPSRVSGLLLDATRDVPGGRLLETRLLSALLESDGRILAGSVPPSRILALAGGSSCPASSVAR